MSNLKYLYYFASRKIDVVEIKRLDLKDGPLSEIYKWLIVRKDSEKVWELDFKSMHKSENKKFRTFIEGAITFDNNVAVLSLFEHEYSLKVFSPEEVPFRTAHSIESYIINRPEKADLYSLGN